MQASDQAAFSSTTLNDVGPYIVTFSINYKTDFGKIVCVSGSLPELGMWKDFKNNHMKWTDVIFSDLMPCRVIYGC